jgi:energy-converting hydrogenase A subunit R
MPRVICFDLEGPLSPQDNAFEVMGVFENGLRIFEIISRYDDLLAMEGREGYEAGDTLALIAPFLVHHDICEAKIKEISDRAMLVDGAKETLSLLIKRDFQVFIISTSYEQHAHNIGNRLDMAPENIACTSFPLDMYREMLKEEDSTFMTQAEEEILELYPPINDLKIKIKLDRFFFGNLPSSPFSRIMKEMRVMGGERKVQAAMSFAQKVGLDLSDIAVIGDSITDFKMLRAVNDAGGLAVAFNANEYAIPHATIGLASTNMMPLIDIIKVWDNEGRDAVTDSFKGRKDRREPYIHVLDGRHDFDDVVEVHKKVRKIVRGRAARLG